MKKKKILIFDDDTSIVEVLTIILEDAGYEPLVALYEKEALTLLNKKPSLILLDVLLSGTDARTFYKKIRANKNTKKTPVIICSANAHTEKIADDLGANDFIIKPFDVGNLVRKINKQLSKI